MRSKSFLYWLVCTSTYPDNKVHDLEKIHSKSIAKPKQSQSKAKAKQEQELDKTWIQGRMKPGHIWLAYTRHLLPSNIQPIPNTRDWYQRRLKSYLWYTQPYYISITGTWGPKNVILNIWQSYNKSKAKHRLVTKKITFENILMGPHSDTPYYIEVCKVI